MESIKKLPKEHQEYVQEKIRDGTLKFGLYDTCTNTFIDASNSQS